MSYMHLLLKRQFSSVLGLKSTLIAEKHGGVLFTSFVSLRQPLDFIVYYGLPSRKCKDLRFSFS